MQEQIERYQNEQDKGPVFMCAMLASTTCDDICDDVQLKAAHALSMYREGSDVTVHWRSRDDEDKTLGGTLMKVWTTDKAILDLCYP